MADTAPQPHRIAFTTCGSAEDAARIARELVARRLAACVNVVPGLRSFYWWEERVQDDAEVLLIIKTRVEMLAQLEQAVAELHSYDLPEFIVLPVAGGAAAYLNWIDRNIATSS